MDKDKTRDKWRKANIQYRKLNQGSVEKNNKNDYLLKWLVRKHQC